MRGEDQVARAVVQNGWGLLELRPMRMSLEEIFLAFYGNGATGGPPTGTTPTTEPRGEVPHAA